MSKNTTRDINRRINATLGLAPIILFFSYASFTQTWYNFSFHTSKLILPVSLKQFTNVSAEAKFSGFDLMKNGMVTSPFGTSSAIQTGPANLPMPFIYLVIAAALLLVSIRVKSWMPVLLSLYLCNLSRGQINNMRFSFESLTHGGKYITQGIGVTTFSNTIWFMSGLSFIIGLQLFKQRKENALGKSIIDILIALQAGHMSKVLSKEQNENVNEKARV